MAPVGKHHQSLQILRIEALEHPEVGSLSKDSPVDWAAAAPKSPAMEAVKVRAQAEINGGNPTIFGGKRW